MAPFHRDRTSSARVPGLGWSGPFRLVLVLLAVLLPAGCRSAVEPEELERLAIGLHAAPVSYDPHRQNDLRTVIVLANIYESLVDFDSEIRVEPRLARSWDTPDDLTWRIYLRDDVLFHDGRPLRADSAVASLERARSLPGSKVTGRLATVDRIRQLDELTVELTTVQPDPTLLNKLTFVFVVPADSPETIETPVGTGPYRVVSRAEDSLDLRAFDGYRLEWRGPAEVRFEFLTDRQERLERLLAGELDLVSRLDPDDAGRLETSELTRLVSRPGLSISFLMLRVDRPPFDDPRVREALDLSLDRQRLVDDLRGGEAVPASQIVHEFVFGYSPDLPLPETAPDRARSLLAEAGYGEGPEVELEYPAGLDLEPLAGQLAAGGFRPLLVPRPWPELLDRLDAGRVSVAYLAWVSTTGDAAHALESLAHSRTADGTYGMSNWSGYSNPRLDRLIEQSEATLDLVVRRQRVEQCMRIFRQDRALLPLLSSNQLFGIRADLVWRPRLDGRIYPAEIRGTGSVEVLPDPG